MKVTILKQGVTDHNGIFEIGAVIDVDNKNGESLIADGYAEALENDESNEPTAEEMAKALDKKYNADELRAAAAAVGVTFIDNAKKSDVLIAIIKAGKYSELMA